MNENKVKSSVVLTLALLFLACQPKTDYIYYTGEGRCANGVQDPDEFGVDCGGACERSCSNVRLLQGELFRRLSLEKRYTYILNGPLIVRDQASLEIPSGTHLKVQPNTGAYIAITQGGQLFVWGTAQDPVIISSNSPDPQPGDWGGIIVCGQAPLGTATNSLSDLGNYYYGGTNNTDSSGYLRYLKIQHAGSTALDESIPFNALSLYGIGKFTQIDHVWIQESMGKGLKIDGGNMEISDLFIENAEDNGLQVNSNWSGSGIRWFLQNNSLNGLSIRTSVFGNQNFSIDQLILSNNQSAGLEIPSIQNLDHFNEVVIKNSPYGFWFSSIEIQNQEWSNSNFYLENIQMTSNEEGFNALFENNNEPFFSIPNYPEWINAWNTN